MVSGLAFLLYLLLDNITTIRGVLRHSNWMLMFAGMGLMLLINVIAAGLFHRLLLKYGMQMALQTSVRMLLWSQIIKYIPGKVWPLLYQASAVGALGAAPVFLLVNLELAAASSMAVLCISVAAWFWPNNVWIVAAVLVLGLALTCVLLRGTGLARVATRWSSRFESRPSLAVGMQGVSCEVAAGFFISTALAYVMAIMLLLKGMTGIPVVDTFPYAAYMGFAWLVGTLTVVAPGGIGIRELAFVALAKLDQRIDGEFAIMLVLAFRFAQVFVDVAGAALVWADSRLRSH